MEASEQEFMPSIIWMEVYSFVCWMLDVQPANARNIRVEKLWPVHMMEIAGINQTSYSECEKNYKWYIQTRFYLEVQMKTLWRSNFQTKNRRIIFTKFSPR